MPEKVRDGGMAGWRDDGTLLCTLKDILPFDSKFLQEKYFVQN